jgi:acyl-CoA thioester hydrolase
MGNNALISDEVAITVQFGDVDSMNVVWHGNYIRYLEQARSSLMAKIGYSYREMNASGYVWPIVDLRVKYVKPIRLLQIISVRAEIMEFENRLKIGYQCKDRMTGELLTKATTIQVALAADTFDLCLECPAELTDRIRALV